MSSQPRISVVIPAYNQAEYLSEALESVLSQTREPAEIIVVDDGSTDDTPAVLERYKRHVAFYRQPNAGISAARNAGLERATGDWVAFLDSDDIWDPRKLERQAALVGENDIVCVHTAYRVFGNTCWEPPPPEEILRGHYELAAMLTRFMVLPSSALVRHDTGLRFYPWATICEDAIYFTELSRCGQFAFLPEPLVAYRKHGTSMSGRAARVADGWRHRLRWVEEFSGLGPAERDSLEERMCRVMAEEVELARWLRDWQRYWKLRDYAAGFWHWTDRPAVLSERVYPRLVYFLKDAVNCLRKGKGSIRLTRGTL